MLRGYSGGQAEYLRAPMADVGPIKVPDSVTGEQALLLLGALIFDAGTARAVDRGQFENIPDDIRLVQRRAQPGRRSLLRYFRRTSNYLRRARRGLLGANRRRVVAGCRRGRLFETPVIR